MSASEVKLMVFGSTGLLGRYVAHYFATKHALVLLTRADYDAQTSSIDALEALLTTHTPTHVINCIHSHTGTFEECIRANSLLPTQLDDLALKHGFRFIHISTNGVFSGKTGNYTERDLADATDAYGLSKRLGERLQSPVLRTSILGESRTHPTGLMEWLKRRQAGHGGDERVEGFTHHTWNGVTCLELVKFMDHMMTHAFYWQGVRHVHSPETLTKYELLKLIDREYDLRLDIVPVGGDEQLTRKHMHLASIASTIGTEARYAFPSIQTQLREQRVFTHMHNKERGAHKVLTQCRLCEGEVHDILHLGDAFALAGGFLPSVESAQREKVYPLTLSLCPACKYIQCKQVVTPDELFKNNYFYFSSMIEPLVAHFKGLAQWIHDRYPRPDLKIIEIGCNDGVLLHPLKALGYRHLIGVDPSRTLLQLHVQEGLVAYNDYFNDTVAEGIVAEHGPQDIFVSCNSFAHIDDMKSILANMKRVLREGTGVAIVEVHDSINIFKAQNFDFIYHEHVGYYTVTSMYNMCKNNSISLVDVVQIPNHGGSLRCVLQMAPDLECPPHVLDLMASEAAYLTTTYMRQYRDTLYAWKNEMRALYDDLRSKNLTIYGYGASGRANTLMGFCGLHLDGIIDDSPSKIGSFTPLFNVEIHASAVMYAARPSEGVVRPPDVVILLAWPYADAIVRNHQKYLEQGGKFIIPLPTITHRRGGAIAKQPHDASGF